MAIGGNGNSKTDKSYQTNTRSQFTMWTHFILLTFFGVKLRITCASHDKLGKLFAWIGAPGAMFEVDLVVLKKEWSIGARNSPKLCFLFNNTTTSDGLKASDFHFIGGRQISPESFVVAREVIAELDGVEDKENRKAIQKKFFGRLDKSKKGDLNIVKSSQMLPRSTNLDSLFRQADALMAVINGTYLSPMTTTTTTKKKKKKKNKKIASDSEEGSSDSEEGSSDSEEGS